MQGLKYEWKDSNAEGWQEINLNLETKHGVSAVACIREIRTGAGYFGEIMFAPPHSKNYGVGRVGAFEANDTYGNSVFSSGYDAKVCVEKLLDEMLESGDVRVLNN